MCLVEVGQPAIDRATGKPELDEDGNPKIRFFPKPMTACTTPVSEGMVVKVDDSEAAVDDRKAVLEFFADQPPLGLPGVRQRRRVSAARFDGSPRAGQQPL